MSISGETPMNVQEVDVVIIGAGPVGLMCAYLGQLCGLRIAIFDKSFEPLQVGRADALNARTLQFLEVSNLFKDLYPLGKPCNTSSVWADGKFVSRQSTWWDNLDGCLHKHFLMLGQAYVEQLLDARLQELKNSVRRCTEVIDVQPTEEGCLTTTAKGERFKSRFVIGADGARSFVRKHFKIPFEVVRPEIVWAVLDGVIDTDFPKVPEIIVFQSETSDVAWIPREGNIDRFYIRMDREDFHVEEALARINRAMRPHTMKFKEMVWSSQFSVKESVAEHFFVNDRVFLVGDACHIHSVNGGQGLNTGLADAFNLMWKIHFVMNHGMSEDLLNTYEQERKPVALSVIETSGELVRSTKYSKDGSHAEDYVKIVERRAGNITGMGIRYGGEGICGTRLFDFPVNHGHQESRLYSLLDFSRFTLLVFSEQKLDIRPPAFIKMIQISPEETRSGYWTGSSYYTNQAILVRPDSYILSTVSVKDVAAVSQMLLSISSNSDHKYDFGPIL